VYQNNSVTAERCEPIIGSILDIYWIHGLIRAVECGPVLECLVLLQMIDSAGSRGTPHRDHGRTDIVLQAASCCSLCDEQPPWLYSTPRIRCSVGCGAEVSFPSKKLYLGGRPRPWSKFVCRPLD
jgi:hypothetical protein